MDAIADAIKGAIHVGVEKSAIKQAKESEAKIEDELAAAEQAAIAAEEAEKAGLVTESVSIAMARAQKRVNERKQRKIATDVAEMHDEAPIKLDDKLAIKRKKRTALKLKQVTKDMEGPNTALVGGVGGPTISTVTKGAYVPPPRPHLAESTEGAIAISKPGLSVHELHKVFPASLTAGEHSTPVIPTVRNEAPKGLSAREMHSLFASRHSSTYNRNVMAVEKKRARARIGRTVVPKIPSGWDKASWPPPQSPPKAKGKKLSIFSQRLYNTESDVKSILSPFRMKEKGAPEEFFDDSIQIDGKEKLPMPPYAEILTQEDEIDETEEYAKEADHGGEIDLDVEEEDKCEHLAMPPPPPAEISLAFAKSKSTNSNDSEEEQPRPMGKRLAAQHKNAISENTDTGREKVRVSGQCIRGRGWSWQHRQPLLEMPMHFNKEGTSEEAFRSETDGAVMLSRGHDGGWKVATSKPLGRSSARSRNLYNTQQKIVKQTRRRKKERTPYALRLHATNTFGAREKFQGNSYEICA